MFAKSVGECTWSLDVYKVCVERAFVSCMSTHTHTHGHECGHGEECILLDCRAAFSQEHGFSMERLEDLVAIPLPWSTLALLESSRSL
jgi:hypothetical protein